MITAKEVRELFAYDPDTGLLKRNIVRSNRVKLNDPVGTPAHGYIQVYIGQKPYYVHRLIWLHVYGRWPIKEIDHINGIRDDNRLINLREASRHQNSLNIVGRKDRTHDFKGTSFHPHSGKWHARIRVNKKVISLKYHDTEEKAHEAYRKAAIEFHGEFASFE